MIQNLIIDFGGVLYEIAPNRTLELFNSYGNQNYSYQQLAAMPVFRDYEVNALSSDEFISKIRNIFDIESNISDKLIQEAWNKTLVGIFPHTISTLKELKKKYNLALLSNTNHLHFDFFAPHCQELFSIFDRCFFSHQIQMRKPNTDIYNYVLSEMWYKSKDTIFIDDSVANLKGAESAGLHTFLVSPDTLLSDFPDTV